MKHIKKVAQFIYENLPLLVALYQYAIGEMQRCIAMATIGILVVLTEALLRAKEHFAEDEYSLVKGEAK